MRYTFAFCLANARQLAQPMPELPPVTMTVLPANPTLSSGLALCGVASAAMVHIGSAKSCVMQGVDTDTVAFLGYKKLPHFNAVGCVLHGCMKGECLPLRNVIDVERQEEMMQ